jgi:hypothetical protein
MGEMQDCEGYRKWEKLRTVEHIGNGRNGGLRGIYDMGEMEDCEGYRTWEKLTTVRDIGNGRNGGL